MNYEILFLDLQYVTQFIEELPGEIFDQFMIHFSRCALAYRQSSERDQRRILLTQLFVSCDHTGVSQIIIYLFSNEYRCQ